MWRVSHCDKCGVRIKGVTEGKAIRCGDVSMCKKINEVWRDRKINYGELARTSLDFFDGIQNYSMNDHRIV